MKKTSLLVLLVTTLLAAGCQLQPVIPERPPEPDIAFMTDRDGNFEIYTMNRDGSDPTNLTNSSENEGLPAWSSRIRAFAFLTDQGVDGLAIQRMGRSGSNRTTMSQDLIPNFSGPVWSPSGEWLAFGGGVDANPDVYLVDATGEELVNITNTPGEDVFADWSPDGHELLFLSEQEGNIAIYRLPAEGGEPTRLTDPQFGSGRPDWSPDGSKIAFMSNRDGDIEIYVMDADGGNVERLTNNPGFDGFPLWSPDGAKIAFLSGRDNNAEIYTMNPDGSGQTNITNAPASQESVEGDFKWSSDGTQIMFHTDRDGNLEVYVMGNDGSNPTNLTNDPGVDFASIWLR